MSNYILIDSIIFIISNIVLGIYVLKNRKLNLKEKIAYTIFFIILNSSYNIMIKSVHQYNLAIPRTYIYRKKIISSFSLLDIICILFIVCNVKYLIENVFKNRLIRAHMIRAVGLYIIGMISFFIMDGYWMDNGNTFLIMSKGWIYSLSTLILVFKYMNKNINLIYPFAVILINGTISTLFVPTDDIWMRYGHKAIIIDQEDASSISNCLITLLMLKCFYVKEPKLTRKIMNCFLLILFLVQNLYCMYKGNLVILPVIFIIYLIITKGKNQILTFATMLGIPTIILVLWNKIYILLTSVAMQTRSAQINDYLNYIQEKGIYPYIFGSGIGTPYYSVTDTGDTGERKEIDIANSANTYWKTEIQTPILSIMKESGILGLIYFFITTVYILLITLTMIKNIVKTKNEKICEKDESYLNIETLGVGLILIVQSVYGIFLYGGVIPYCIFYTFCLSRFVINYQNIKEREKLKNENINNK